MRFVFFTFYYPPDLSAGSFRSIALAKSLKEVLRPEDEIHIITTQPNRYNSYSLKAKNTEKDGLITIHRINVPSHSNRMFSQSYSFFIFSINAYKLSRKIQPNFLIGTSSRLMTAFLTWAASKKLKKNYYIDLRDIFSESISDIFSQRNKYIGLFLRSIFIFLERRILTSASGVNVVSQGFLDYFEKLEIDTSHWSFFPNGVDKEFKELASNNINSLNTKIKTILYAGNIGTGQGLDTIIPSMLQNKEFKFKFRVIGDGSALDKLKNSIESNNFSKIEFLEPVERSELLNIYLEADILFLHLNNIPAYKRVLPSKIFEYVAIGKPIVAGISGYSMQFLKENISHAFYFEPGDSNSAIESVLKASDCKVVKDEVYRFAEQYSRESIMRGMAKIILKISKQ